MPELHAQRCKGARRHHSCQAMWCNSAVFLAAHSRSAHQRKFLLTIDHTFCKFGVCRIIQLLHSHPWELPRRHRRWHPLGSVCECASQFAMSQIPSSSNISLATTTCNMFCSDHAANLYPNKHVASVYSSGQQVLFELRKPLHIDKIADSPPAPVGAKELVFPEALTRSAFARGSPRR